MSGDSGEKTEEPTQKKLDDSRKRGQVWRSRDLSSLALFVVGMATLKVVFPGLQDKITHLFHFTIDQISHPADISTGIVSSMFIALTDILILSLPVALASSLMAALVDFLQIGALFTVDPLIPKLDKLNPLAGAKNLVSKKQAVELLKSMFKMGITGYVVYGVVRDAMAMVVSTIRADAATTMLVMGELVFRISVRVSLLFLVFAIFDVWFQRRNYMKDLMMTKDEVKREYKESEGDPQVKGQRRQMYNDMLQDAEQGVKGASAVVTNPDHLAIAIAYDKEKDGAPRIVARGMDERAQALKEMAKRYEVPILRNVPLAHALYRVEVGQEIPEELYDAVAEVLNFVYQMKASA